MNGGVRKGMRVFPANSAPCNICFYCKKGQPNLCEDLLFNNGAYAEYIRIPGRIHTAERARAESGNYADAAVARNRWLARAARDSQKPGIKKGDTAVVMGCSTWVEVHPYFGAAPVPSAKARAMDIAERLGADRGIQCGRELKIRWRRCGN